MFDNPILKPNWAAKHFLPYEKEFELTSKEKCGHQNIPDWFFSMVRSLTEPTSKCIINEHIKLDFFPCLNVLSFWKKH